MVECGAQKLVWSVGSSEAKVTGALSRQALSLRIVLC
jgi:hypothetical protein